MNFNKVFFAGNLTMDPDRRVTPSGHTITKFSVASNRRYKTQAGEPREEATFVEITVFGTLGDTIVQYFQKGMPIFVEGRLKLDQWEAQDGSKRSKLGVILESFQFVGGKKEEPPARSTATPAHDPIDDDEDIPF